MNRIRKPARKLAYRIRPTIYLYSNHHHQCIYSSPSLFLLLSRSRPARSTFRRIPRRLRRRNSNLSSCPYFPRSIRRMRRSRDHKLPINLILVHPYRGPYISHPSLPTQPYRRHLPRSCNMCLSFFHLKPRLRQPGGNKPLSRNSRYLLRSHSSALRSRRKECSARATSMASKCYRSSYSSLRPTTRCHSGNSRSLPTPT